MRKIVLILFIFLLNSCKGSSQSYNCVVKFDNIFQDSVYIQVTKQPTFLNEEGHSISDYILKNIKIDEQEEIQFRIICSLIITKNGLPVLIKIRNKEPEEYTNLEKQIINIVSKMTWKPGMCGEKIVASYTLIPIYLSY